MSDDAALRATIDALAEKINRLKRERSGGDPEVAALVAEMIELRKKLPAKAKPVKAVELPYFEQRVKTVEEMGPMGAAYPHKFAVTHRVPALRAQFADRLTSKGQRLNDVVTVAGRVVSKRSSGSKLHFLVLQGDGDSVQVLSNAGDHEAGLDAFTVVHQRVKRGDIVGVRGVCGMSNTGEFSIMAHDLTLLSPCYHMLPEGWYGFSNVEQRFRQRYLDFIVNPQNVKTFRTRSAIISYIRRFFLGLEFDEVETPILNPLAGGAAARPFATHHHELDITMYLRIAPELPLKMLVVGGMDRVFEIGRQFRNEGMDLTHNPEFTSVEAYWAYADYNDLITMTEDLLEGLAIATHGSTDVVFAPVDAAGKPLDSPVTFNFKKPFRRLYIVPELEARMGVDLPQNFDSDETNAWLVRECAARGVECHPPTTTARLFDALIAHYLEPECTQPTFIMDHPRVMSPLAKWHRNDNRLSERFELFLNKKELINAYTELNNPLVQRAEFEKQARSKAKGDVEAMPVDEAFLRALEHGLPPTAGWGLGVDRLVMFLTSNVSIREVLLFPAMRPEEKSNARYAAGTPLNGQGVPRLNPILRDK